MIRRSFFFVCQLPVDSTNVYRNYSIKAVTGVVGKIMTDTSHSTSTQGCGKFLETNTALFIEIPNRNGNFIEPCNERDPMNIVLKYGNICERLLRAVNGLSDWSWRADSSFCKREYINIAITLNYLLFSAQAFLSRSALSLFPLKIQ